MEFGAVAVARHESDDVSWEMARRAPHPGLGDHVVGYCGYAERGRPLRRREVPDGGVTLIVTFGEPISIATARAPGSPETFRSFVAGLHTEHVVTEHQGRQLGVQIDLTPVGAYRVLGLPMCELANQVVALDAVRGRAVDRLADELASLGGWDERLHALDRALLRWTGDGPDVDAPVAWAWRQLHRSDGRVAIGALVDEIGWSRRHFTTRFREQVGLAPKPTARVLRFRRAVDRLGGGTTISDVAAESGYADHSHLVRDFRAFAGCTPSELLAARLPDGFGLAG